MQVGTIFLFLDSDNEISKQKFSKVTEALKSSSKQSDMESESPADDIEIPEKPERADIEKKLE